MTKIPVALYVSIPSVVAIQLHLQRCDWSASVANTTGVSPKSNSLSRTNLTIVAPLLISDIISCQLINY